ncbi:MAG: Rab family GTPase [Thermoplasmata archaeon]
MNQVKVIMKKMCVIGDGGVGKTSLIRRFVIDKFDDKYIATIGTKTSRKTMIIKDDDANVNLTLIIWDILGQRNFTRINKAAYRGANGAFIVLDLSRRETLYSFGSWLLSLHSVAGGIPVIVLVNKNDLKAGFGKDEIETLVKDYGFPYYLTSAKTGENVNEAFYSLGKMMLKSWADMNIGAQLRISKAPENEMDVEIGPNKKLSVIEVEDIIMTRYCDLLEDLDFAMAIIRKQFKRADVDFKFPTTEGLAKVVDYLIDAASDQVEATRLRDEESTYSTLIRRID